MGGAPLQRTLIVGAGRAGMLLCRELQDHPGLGCRVLGFVDDALEKQGLRIQGVPVLGPTDLLPLYIREQRATQVILGMAWAPGARLRELAALAREEGVEVKTVPGIHSLVMGQSWKPEVRDIAIEDLLRREPITLDTAGIRAAVAGAVVLITGGGGSIGSELARTVAQLGPERVVLLGRGENSLWEAQREMARLLPEQQVAMPLSDIHNPARLRQVFQAWRPEVVMHAAAHKHVPFLEEHPEEAIENNSHPGGRGQTALRRRANSPAPGRPGLGALPRVPALGIVIHSATPVAGSNPGPGRLGKKPCHETLVKLSFPGEDRDLVAVGTIFAQNQGACFIPRRCPCLNCPPCLCGISCT